MSTSHMLSGNSELDAKICEWLRWDKNCKTLRRIDDLIMERKFDVLSDLLLSRLSFGTAGLRGKMDAGYNSMNDLVIVQTAQGLLKYLVKEDEDILKRNGIVVGYDARHNSKRFAELTAAIFLHKEYPVRIFNTVVPTPFISFAVVQFSCVMGIMVTASHNPKEDNGFKVYGSNGAQITSPTDKNIQQSILDNLEPLQNSWDTSILESSSHKINPMPEVLNGYMNMIKDGIFLDHKEINAKSSLRFVYTPMHGVGFIYVARAMQLANLKIIPVEQQKYPDPDFPTVRFPNPEEGKSALDLAIQTAEYYKCSIILANDPDADRLAVAELNKDTGEWKIFNGNELGALLGWWAFHCYQKKYPLEPCNNVYMLASTVSSKILRSMARIEGFSFVETLTGFKWMGNKTDELIQKKKTVIFAFEEAIGFMWGTGVLDKDGVSAAVHMATLAAYLNNHDMTLVDQLLQIYEEYGNHVSLNSYYICYEKPTIEKIFERIRNFNGPSSYPNSILNGKYIIENVRDLTTGYDDSQPDNQAILPVSKESHMITFEFENGLVATIRTSGTEPKIKYYTEMCAQPKQGSRTQIQETLKEMAEAICEELLQPELNRLIAKSD